MLSSRGPASSAPVARDDSAMPRSRCNEQSCGHWVKVGKAPSRNGHWSSDASVRQASNACRPATCVGLQSGGLQSGERCKVYAGEPPPRLWPELSHAAHGWEGLLNFTHGTPRAACVLQNGPLACRQFNGDGRFGRKLLCARPNPHPAGCFVTSSCIPEYFRDPEATWP